MTTVRTGPRHGARRPKRPIFLHGWGGYPPHTVGPRNLRWVAAWAVFWTACILLAVDSWFLDQWLARPMGSRVGRMASWLADAIKGPRDRLLNWSARIQDDKRGPWKSWR